MTILHKIGAYAIVATVLSVTIGLGYNHYQGLLADIQVLEGNNAKLELAIEVEKATVDILQEGILEWQTAAEEYQHQVEALKESEAEARSESRRLNDIFGQHNLTRLARAKPGLIESRINSGTQRVFAILTCETTTPGRCDSDGNPVADEADPSQP